jgi:hypothetical protein
MRVVHPHRRLDEPCEREAVRQRLEADLQRQRRRLLRASAAGQSHVAGAGSCGRLGPCVVRGRAVVRRARRGGSILTRCAGRPRTRLTAWRRSSTRRIGSDVARKRCGRDGLHAAPQSGGAALRRLAQRQTALSAGGPLDERREQRVVAGEVAEDTADVALHGSGPRRALRRGLRRAPRLEVRGDGFLDRFAVRQEERAAAAVAEEVALVERERFGEGGDLDQALDAVGVGGCEAEPVPAAADHLAECADGEAALVVGERRVVARDVAEAGWLPLSADPHAERMALRRADRAHDRPVVDDGVEAVRIARRENVDELGLEERLEVAHDRRLDEAGFEQCRERVRQPQQHGGAIGVEHVRRLDPRPWRARAVREAPRRRRVLAAAARLGDHLVARQQAQLDADAREADALATPFQRRGEVLVAGQLAPRHAAAVVESDECALRGIGLEPQRARAGVEGIGDDLREDRLLEAARVRIAQVLEKPEQVYAGFAHGGCRAYAAARGGVKGIMPAT